MQTLRSDPRIPGAAAALAALVLLATCRDGGGGGAANGGSGGGPTTGTGGGSEQGGAGGGQGGGGAEDGAVTGFSRGDLLAAFGTCAAAAVRDFRARAGDARCRHDGAGGRARRRDARRRARGLPARDGRLAGRRDDAVRTDCAADDARGAGLPRQHLHLAATTAAARSRERSSPAATSRRPSRPRWWNRRGLAAIEYLLFYEGADTACPPTSPTVASWAALAADDRDARKRAYAAAATQDVSRRAQGLDAAWDPAAGNFVQTLRTAGPGNAVYATTQVALNGRQRRDLLRRVRDQGHEAGAPAGRGHDGLPVGPAPSCWNRASRARSKANIRANLDGLRRILEGCGADHAGLGFDDLLRRRRRRRRWPTRCARSAIAAQAALDAIEEPDLESGAGGRRGVGRRAATTRSRARHRPPQDRVRHGRSDFELPPIHRDRQ